MKKAPLLVLFLTLFIDLLGFGIVITQLPYYAREYNATGKVVGAVLAVYSLMQFFFSPVWGRLSDRVGRRPVLLISLSGSVIGYATFALAQSLPMLFLARILSGISAANIGTAQAYVADKTTDENRAKGMGLIGVAFGLGFILGPPVGGILSSAATSRGFHGNLFPGIAAASLSLLALTVALFALPESRDPHLPPRKGGFPFFDRDLWRLVASVRALPLLLGTLFLILIAFAGMEPAVVLYGKEHFRLTPRELGYMFGYMGVIVAVIQGGLIGRLTRRLGERAVIAIGALSLAIGLVLVPSIDHVPYLYIAGFFIAIGQGFCYPSIISLITKVSPRANHGSILGISSSVGSLSRVIGPLMAGALYDLWREEGTFYGAAIVVFAALMLALTLHRSREPEPVTEASVS